jgi:hypothetical protein
MAFGSLDVTQAGPLVERSNFLQVRAGDSDTRRGVPRDTVLRLYEPRFGGASFLRTTGGGKNRGTSLQSHSSFHVLEFRHLAELRRLEAPVAGSNEVTGSARGNVAPAA